jgi:hypothetical protein
MSDATTIIEAFGRLKTGSRDGKRLPHKPLLVLLALDRWANGERDPVKFADVRQKLLQLIRTYGPEGSGSPEEPFWRLRLDGIWDLDGTEHLTDPNVVTPPGMRAMNGVTGHFSAEVCAALWMAFLHDRHIHESPNNQHGRREQAKVPVGPSWGSLPAAANDGVNWVLWNIECPRAYPQTSDNEHRHPAG